LNIGLAWMAFVSLFPLGVLQLYESVDNGYWSARTLAFNFGDINNMLEWIRLPGDVLFIVGGILPLLWLAILGVRFRGTRSDHLSDEDLQLFTEDANADPEGAVGAGSA
jgi:nitric oxide reductase subunit B